MGLRRPTLLACQSCTCLLAAGILLILMHTKLIKACSDLTDHPYCVKQRAACELPSLMLVSSNAAQVLKDANRVVPALFCCKALDDDKNYMLCNMYVQNSIHSCCCVD